MNKTYVCPIPFSQSKWDKYAAKAIAKTEQFGECMCYTGARNEKGYGRIEMWSDGVPRFRYAHRIVMEATLGRVLETQEYILHSCDNPPCINPNHLRVGTALENTRDSYLKKRHYPSAKLSDERVREIRRLRTEGLTFTQVAKRYDISKPAAQHICARRTWKHVA